MNTSQSRAHHSATLALLLVILMDLTTGILTYHYSYPGFQLANMSLRAASRVAPTN